MNYEKLAKEILANIGGKENVLAVTHCFSRLRLTLDDYSKVDKEKIEKLDGVVGTSETASQFQVVIGDKVIDVYEAILPMLSISESTDISNNKENKNIFGLFAETVSGVFQPIIAPITGSGLMTGLQILLVNLNLIKEGDALHTILSVMGNVAFYFLPFLVAISAAKRFKVNPYMALTVVGVLVHPTFLNLLLEGKTSLLVAGIIPVTLADYSSTVIPALLTVYILSKLEKLLNNKIPRSFGTILVPMLEMLIMTPIALIIIGPLGKLAGDFIAQGFLQIYGMSSIIASILLGGLYPLIVLTGTHLSLVPVMLESINQTGVDYIMPLMSIANTGLAGAALAVYFKTKDAKTKAVAGSGALVTGIGITEPALYGICLKYKTPLYAALIGGGIGGAYFGIFKVSSIGLGLSPLGSLPLYFGSTFVHFIIGTCITLVASFVITTVIWKEDLTSETNSSTELPKDNNKSGVSKFRSPLTGDIKPLTEVSDAVFSEKMLGDGFAIDPTEGILYAPFSGTVTALFDTKHVIGITGDDGTEVLMHIGIDTVKLNGKYFDVLVSKNQKVKEGQELIRFNLEKIKSEGYDCIVPIVFTNGRFPAIDLEEKHVTENDYIY